MVDLAGWLCKTLPAAKKAVPEERLVQDMPQCAGETDDRHSRKIRTKSECSHTEPQGDDADVLDTVVSEQALEIMLRKIIRGL
jgi:hypothetical protein